MRALASVGVACALAGITLAGAPRAAAGPSRTEIAAARELFGRAERDEDAGRWADALEKLRRAAAVKQTPGIRFHVALCEEKTGQLVAALSDYDAAAEAARVEGNKEVTDAIAEPIASLRARIPTLTIVTPPDSKDAAVSLDGAPIAASLLGVAVPVDPGAHEVVARAPGRPPFSTSLSAAEGQSVSVEIHFPVAAPRPASPPPSEAAPGSAAGDGAQRGRSTSPSRGAAVLSTVGAAGLVGFGVAAYFVAGGKQSSAEAACLELTSCDDLKGGVHTWDALALGGWIAGAGVAALSVYLWARGGSPADRGGAQLRVGPGSLRLVADF